MTDLLGRMFDGWPLAVVLVNSQDGTITYINPACRRGLPADQDWVGRQFADLAIEGWDQPAWSETTPIGRLLEPGGDAGKTAALPSHPSGCTWIGSRLDVDDEILGTEHMTDEPEARRQHKLMAGRVSSALRLEESREMNGLARQMLDRSDRQLELLEQQLAGSMTEVLKRPRPPAPRPMSGARQGR